MINPLINKHPGDTLHCIYCVLDLLESLPNEDHEGAFLSQNQIFGYFCVIQCVKNALLFESARISKIPEMNPDDVPHPAKIARHAKRIPYPRLKNRFYAEFWRAIDLCHKPESIS